MKWMGLNEIRRLFIDFFKQKEHLYLDSFSLVPKDDFSLLFINSDIISAVIFWRTFMKWMGLNEIRRLFIDFFKQKEHLYLDSFSLVPKDDFSLLFINSGLR